MKQTSLIPELSQALFRSVEDGNRCEMDACASELVYAFRNEVSDPFAGYGAALLRFHYFKGIIKYMIAIGEFSHAGTEYNRCKAHWFLIRGRKEYTIEHKRVLGRLFKEINLEMAPVREMNRKKREERDRDSDEFKHFRFTNKAYKWFAEAHELDQHKALNYLLEYQVSSLLEKLPINTPKRQTVELMTSHCYENGGHIIPRHLQKRFSPGGQAAKHLYIIGNGFDIYHGAKSQYRYFREYLLRVKPDIVATFDLYFGQKSLCRSFKSPEGILCCMNFPWKYNSRIAESAEWSRDHLWSDFEGHLSELNREKVFDILDMNLPDVDEDDPAFRYSDFYGPLGNISDAVRNCTFEMKYRFHRWINTLHYKKGFRKKMFTLDRDALYLNFNYTTFLESEYGIPRDNICYIHGNRKDKFGSLILGHHVNDDEAYQQWKHKNRNRKRYRDVQKDSKGRYFQNDKLTYLAFFLKDERKGNWRLPIRNYAVKGAEDRLEKYYDENYKNTHAIIHTHMGFFDSLTEVDKITIIGHSLSEVDMAYFKSLKDSVKDGVKWEISYHDDKDLKRIDRFKKKMRISDSDVSLFAI